MEDFGERECEKTYLDEECTRLEDESEGRRLEGWWCLMSAERNVWRKSVEEDVLWEREDGEPRERGLE